MLEDTIELLLKKCQQFTLTLATFEKDKNPMYDTQ